MSSPSDIKCIECDQPAEYIWFGSSYCKEHLIVTIEHLKKIEEQQDVFTTHIAQDFSQIKYYGRLLDRLKKGGK